jgi:hypothetical protein
MSDHPSAVLAAAEGLGAEIAWVVISILCWILMIAPFALWWAGVRTPRSERHARRAAAATAADATAAVPAADDEPVRIAG